MSSSSGEASLSSIRIPKAAELVAEQLRRQIVRGELKEGDLLPQESVLLKQFGISRPTLREAIRVLESEALLSVRRGAQGGARVEIPRVELAAQYTGLVLQHRGTRTDDVFTAATTVEAPCARMLAETRSTASVDRLKAAVAEEQTALDDPQRLVMLQTQFHQLVVDLVGNQTLSIMTAMLRHIIDSATYRYVSRVRDDTVASHAGSKAHQKLVALVEAGDASGAEALWRKHITETGKHLLDHGVGEQVVDLLD